MYQGKRKQTIPTFKKENFLARLVRVKGELAIRIQAKNYYDYFLETYGKEGMEVGVIIELRKPKRTNAQNAFYWSYLGLISLSSGHTPDEIHNWAKGMFLTTGITEVFGSKVRKTNSTTNLNRSEFVEYLARIEEATGIPVPDPEPFGIGLTLSEYDKLKTKQKETYKNLRTKLKGI